MEELRINAENSSLPSGYKWECYEDGSGCILGPDKKSYFSYDMAPYANVGWIEYKNIQSGAWEIFDGTLAEFKKFAEESFAPKGDMNLC